MTVYASILESYAHRVGMHTPKISRRAFRRHGQHHQEHLNPDFLPPERYSFRDSDVPWLWVIHIPLYIGLGFIWNIPAASGASFSAGLYVLAYEGLHFLMHARSDHWIKRTTYFQTRLRDHLYHHEHPKRNFNVVFPLGDLWFGTYGPDQRSGVHTVN